MPRPSVSVVVPVFNRTEFLGEALESVLSQTYAGRIEVIVVDDGSEIPIASMFMRDFPQVRFLRQANRGLGAARRTGSQAATGELLGHLDDDDIWPADSLHRRSEVLAARTDVHVVAGDIAHFWPHKPAVVGYYRDRFPRLTAAPRQMLPGCENAWVFARGSLVDAILLGLPFFAQSILSRREWFHAIGGWDAHSTIFTECYGFCYRATMAGAIGWVDEPVAHLRRGHVQATSDTAVGRIEECKGLADWGRRLSENDRRHVAPRLARRLLVQSAKFARRGRLLTALDIAGEGVKLVSSAPLAFAQRPWRRRADRWSIEHAPGH
jgi:glycosyltransferase involved in cell wall biosynthesis